MRPEQSIHSGDSGDGDDSHIHRRVTSLEFDERLLPTFEERQRHAMDMEKQRQDDDSRTVQSLIKESASIAKRGQFFGWTIALGGLIGGVYLISIGEQFLGGFLLFGDGAFVAANTLQGFRKNDE